jgi:hypothetical protein
MDEHCRALFGQLLCCVAANAIGAPGHQVGLAFQGAKAAAHQQHPVQQPVRLNQQSGHWLSQPLFLKRIQPQAEHHAPFGEQSMRHHTP